MQTNVPHLSALLILCPTGHHLSYATEVSIDRLCEAGATKLRSNGNSDVTMHRCQLAGQAARLLRVSPSLRYVLWLDGDMVAPVEVVEQLVGLVHNLASVVPVPPELGDDEQPRDLPKRRRLWCPAVSAAYVKRNAPQYFALQKLITAAPEPEVGSLFVSHGYGEEPVIWELIPVVAGMGALCQTREAFLQHVEEAKPIIQGKETFPGVTASGPALNVRGELAWGSEDWTYCSWEWQYGRGVYLAQHLRFGHVGEQVQWPSDSTTFAE